MKLDKCHYGQKYLVFFLSRPQPTPTRYPRRASLHIHLDFDNSPSDKHWSSDDSGRKTPPSAGVLWPTDLVLTLAVCRVRSK